MRIIGHPLLNDFARRYPDAARSLSDWAGHIRSQPIGNFAELRNAFGSADVVGQCIVFNIRGNRYRLIAQVGFADRVCHVKAILTHAAYDRRKWMKHTAVKDSLGSGWPEIVPRTTMPPITGEADHAFATSVLEYLGDHGATQEGSAHRPLYRLLFDAIYDYEQVHCPLDFLTA
ncbi:type II toxin-antitoxin system HigB family toxin [Luteibacter pinisoli]|uniref:type II toxin-antitoxin system HigB family toxin n=1 Tax=Luteibacter pinisoli TaxID=2589080 RepID=UPI0014771D8C|nr:type II toxin-antitoxin system HigB family toxin [Luteibacter pinisoli]